MRALVTLLAVCGSLLAAAPAAAADRIERGIVQSLGPTSVVLRALDGTDVTVTLGPATRYRLNGRLVTQEALRPGLVAEAVSNEAGITRVLRAFGRRPDIEDAIIVRRRGRALILRLAAGDSDGIRVALTARTRVWWGATRVSRQALRPGMVVDIVVARDSSARVVRVVGRRA